MTPSDVIEANAQDRGQLGNGSGVPGSWVPRHARWWLLRDRFGWVTNPSTVFAMITVGVVAFRLDVLQRVGAPTGIDAGNWLAFGHAIAGDSVRDSTIIYPPLVPGLTLAISNILGPTWGVVMFAAASSVLVGISVFLVTRWSGFRWAAVVLASVALCPSTIGEAAAWGGYPQLIGLAALVLYLWWLDEVVGGWCWLAALGCAGALMVILLSTHLVAMVAVVAGGVVVLARVLDRRATKRLGMIGRAVLVGLPALLVLPVYVPLLSTVAGTVSSSTDPRSSTAGLLFQIEHLSREARWVWIPAFVVATFTPLPLLARRGERLWVLTTTLVVSAWALAIFTAQGRFLYVLAISVPFAAALWWSELVRMPFVSRRAVRRGVSLAALVGATVLALLGLGFFDAQVRYYAVLSPNAVEALDWLRANTAEDSEVLVNSVDLAPAGWWVEGLGERRAWYDSNLEWLNFPDERRRAELAKELLADGFPNAAELDQARQHGIDYVLIIRTRPEERDKYRVPDGVEFLFWRPDVVIVSISPKA